jgi:alpha-2-macroglobulin
MFGRGILMMRRFVVGFALLAACGGNKSALDEVAAPASGEAGSDAVDPDAPLRTELTAERLAPVIRELGPDGVVPSAIVVSFGVTLPAGTNAQKVVDLKITPEVAGSFAYASSSSEVRFTPTNPLDFDTTYTVELRAIHTKDRTITPPAGAAWSRTFRTPKFKLAGFAPVELVAGRSATMELAFSGPVLPNVALAAMTFTIDGKPPAANPTVRSRGGRGGANRVLVQLADPALKPGAKLEVALAEGFAAVSDAKAPAARLSYTIAKQPIASIKSARFVEGGSGYYLEVACDDDAAPTANRSYYYEDGESGSGMSLRCQLADEAVAKITFDPPVAKPYIAPGRSGFRVFGDFQRGVYRVKIDAGAQTIDGGVVVAPFVQSATVAVRKPHLAFASTGRYLPRKAWSNLGIKHLNVDQVNLVVRQVPPENLVFWLGDPQSDAADERTSNVILKKTLQLRGKADQAATSWQDVAALLPATTKGVLELKLAGVETNATSRLLLTDLSLVAKKTSAPDKPWLQTVRVWALDSSTTALEDDVVVTLVRKSGAVVATCTTDGDAGCTLAVNAAAKDPDQSEPFALIARKGDDLTYLRYQDLKADTTESSTSGAPYVASTPYRAAIYSDRGVYRPGEVAHVVAIVRDAKDRAPAQPLPVDIQIVDPKTKVVRKQTIVTNAAGVVAVDHAFPAFADTGNWRVSFAVADKPLESYSLQVEEYVPERMAATVTPARKAVLLGEPVELQIAARYLFGGSALDSGVTLKCSYAPGEFAPDENGELTYGVRAQGKATDPTEVEGQLDAAGTITLACPDADASSFTATTRVTAQASVLEAGSGRSTVRTTAMLAHPEKFYIGVKTRSPVVTSGRPFTVEGMVVDWTGKLAPGAAQQVEVELAHLEADYGYGYDADSGEATYERNMRTVPEGKRTVAVVGGKFSFEVTPGDADLGYVVKLRSAKARTDLVLDGLYPYEYYSEYFDNERVDQTPRPTKPTKLAVKLPKQVDVGKPVEVKAIAPYGGRILWTVETDQVVRATWASTQGGDATWSFTLDQFAPNVYVTAFLVKDPHLESRDAFLPDRAFGVASTRVTPTHATQGLSVVVPKEVRSSSPLQVTLDLGGPVSEPTVATVAVVDEGILSLTNFQTPDPTARLFAQRALGVETFETIGWTMLHQPAGASSRTGGGDDGEASEAGAEGKLGDTGRITPVKSVALFSGVLPVSPDGKLTIPFQIPSYRGQVRVMAITSSASKVGRAEAKVIVRDPLVVQTTFPRFLTAGDELKIPVFVTNVSGGKLAITLKLDSSELAVPGIAPKVSAAPLAFTERSAGSVDLADGRSETLVFPAKALLTVGGAKLRVVATATGPAGSFTVTDEVEVPFLPAGPKDRSVTKIQLAAGKLDLSANPALKNWVPTSETTTFWVTTNPYGASFEHLRYLVHYPYGCIEQTASSTRPLLYVGGLVEQLDGKLGTAQLQDMVLAGINRIFAMQTPAGGFSYWPGGTEPEDWGTAYATHMLLDAKQAGYTVPEDRLREVLAWIDRRAAAYEQNLTKYDRTSWGYYHGQVQAYFHYVLARAGKGKKARILKLISDYPAAPKPVQAEDLYLLKAALYLAGDRRYEKDLKTVDASPITADRANSWSFYSDLRRRGLMLSTYFDLFGANPAGEPLVQRVAQGLEGQASQYYNTQELVWGVTGLGKWIGATQAKAKAGGTLAVDGAVLTPRKAKTATKGTSDRTWVVARASEYGAVTLDVPADAAGAWLVIASEGVRPNATYKVGGNGLAVSRTFKQLDGTPVDLAAGTVRLGDVLYVEVELANTSGAWIENIALVDRLPAGLEIENPRLGRDGSIAWAKADEAWSVDFQNMRDDRVEAFGGLAARAKKKLVYSVRAVTSGRFTVPPLEAEAMYDATLWGRAAGGTAVIGGPWTSKTI